MRLKTFFFPLQEGKTFDFTNEIQEIEKQNKVKAVSISSVFVPHFMTADNNTLNRPAVAVSVLFEPAPDKYPTVQVIVLPE